MDNLLIDFLILVALLACLCYRYMSFTITSLLQHFLPAINCVGRLQASDPRK